MFESRKTEINSARLKSNRGAGNSRVFTADVKIELTTKNKRLQLDLTTPSKSDQVWSKVSLINFDWTLRLSRYFLFLRIYIPIIIILQSIYWIEIELCERLIFFINLLERFQLLRWLFLKRPVFHLHMHSLRIFLVILVSFVYQINIDIHHDSLRFLPLIGRVISFVTDMILPSSTVLYTVNFSHYFKNGGSHYFKPRKLIKERKTDWM